MSTGKRKISIRKVIQTLVTIVVVTGFTMAILSADRLQSRKKLTKVDVQIRNGETVHFIDEGEVMKMLFTDRHLDPYQLSLGKLDINKMENIARSNPWVSDAQVYVDNERAMHISVTQRVPVVRVFEESGHSYYLDRDLNAMPLSDRYVHYTPLVTGAPVLREDDSISRDIKGTMLALVSYITRSKFWNAQIAQIVIGRDKTFELIPVLGKQRILLGDTSHVPEKLNNLLAFYQQVENKVGWEKYEVIDLRFKGQVVASPALKWKIPVDRALTNMNWVKAVMESAPKDDKDESVSNALDTGMAGGRMATDNIQVRVAASRPERVATPAPPAARPQPVVAIQKPTQLKPEAEKPKPAAHAKPKVPAITKPVVKPAAAVKPKPKTGETTAGRKPSGHSIKPNAPAPNRKPVTPKKDDKKPAAKPKPADKPGVKKPKPETTTRPKKPAANHH